MSTTRTSPWLIVALGALAVGGVVFALRHAESVGRLADEAGSIDLRIAVAGLLLSGVAMLNRGLLNRAAHRAVGLDAGAMAMTRTAAVGFAAQKMVKSAGAAGLAVFVRHGRRRGHSVGAVTAACVLSAASSFVALGVLLAAAIAVLSVTGRMTGWWAAAAAGFALYAAAVAVVVMVVVRHRAVAVRCWIGIRRTWGRVTRRPVGPTPDAVPTELFVAVDLVRRRPGSVGPLLVHGVLSKVLGSLMLVTAVAAVGVPVSPAGAVVVYATALGASMVTIVPGGVGAVEGSTAALLVASGASIAAATLAVALFRCFDLLVPVISGAVAARHADPDPDPVEDRSPPELLTAAA